MRLLVRRVETGTVQINGAICGQIQRGLTVYLGIGEDDESSDLEWGVKKILGLRIFDDLDGKMNLPISEKMGILVISQFTLWGNVKKGYRPSFNRAASPHLAEPMYDSFLGFLKKSFDGNVQCGKFGADMKIELHEDGPVSIWLDSKDKNY
jgi:D-tyrosyl-tRNA(Tyr) deacylase